MARLDPRRFDDLFSDFGPITLRRLFGGEGVYAGGIMIGLVMDDRVYLKTDDATRPDFIAEDAKPFGFMKGGKRIETAYYAIPERLYDDPSELAQWARRAESVARAKVKKKKR